MFIPWFFTAVQRPSKAKQEVIENYHRRKSSSSGSSGEDNFSVTQHLIRNSRPGNKGILSPPPV